MRIAIGTVALNLTLNLILIWPLAEAGLAWSTAASSIVPCVLLARLARRRLLSAPVLDRDASAAIARTIVATASMGVTVLLVLLVMPDRDTWGAHAAALAGSIAAGAGVYAIVSRALGAPELAWLLARNSSPAAPPADEPDDANAP